ncbi:hypothetical protein SCWH03_31590 [Streptomyces pacificus]|uniref:Uncharacterized protein n=1 Tax=Streptomyces pacificus TaxID=2705029 RepID=A0A6A0AVI9_9ACTN|nr:hypothetical protein SCWH03_31590 [Streptomyces pacificus]
MAADRADLAAAVSGEPSQPITVTRSAIVVVLLVSSQVRTRAHEARGRQGRGYPVTVTGGGAACPAADRPGPVRCGLPDAAGPARRAGPLVR